MRSLFLFLALLGASLVSLSQTPIQTDTLRLSIPEAEKRFLQNNLSLIAAKYNVDANKALISQAKRWDNPVLVTDQNIYDGRFFRHNSQYGQVFVQVTQLIKTAGKRSKLAQLATDNTAIARAQFEDILRSLHYTLTADMIESANLQKISRLYQDEIVEVEKLVKGMEQVYQLGNISLKDDMRLKAVLFSLQNDLINVQSQLLPLQTEMRILLQSGDGSYILPQLSYRALDLVNQQLPAIDSLVRTALANRPDLQIAQINRDFQVHNLSFQKALAKPDLTIGPEFDQRNSYAPNYTGLTLSIPLNIFNRNQGNIKAAASSLQQEQTEFNLQSSRVTGEISASAEKFLFMQHINSQEQADFTAKYDSLFQNMVKSYQARQINLLDFTDFLDAYKETRLKLSEQQINLLKAAAELNYVSNYPVVPVQ